MTSCFLSNLSKRAKQMSTNPSVFCVLSNYLPPLLFIPNSLITLRLPSVFRDVRGIECHLPILSLSSTSCRLCAAFSFLARDWHVNKRLQWPQLAITMQNSCRCSWYVQHRTLRLSSLVIELADIYDAECRRHLEEIGEST